VAALRSAAPRRHNARREAPQAPRHRSYRKPPRPIPSLVARGVSGPVQMVTTISSPRVEVEDTAAGGERARPLDAGDLKANPASIVDNPSNNVQVILSSVRLKHPTAQNSKTAGRTHGLKRIERSCVSVRSKDFYELRASRSSTTSPLRFAVAGRGLDNLLHHLCLNQRALQHHRPQRRLARHEVHYSRTSRQRNRIVAQVKIADARTRIAHQYIDDLAHLCVLQVVVLQIE
jgi:hypothetical protein